MEDKKRVAILVTIALILAITAITLNLSDSQVPTSGNVVKNTEAGQIGIKIQPAPLEDKLAEETKGEQP